IAAHEDADSRFLRGRLEWESGEFKDAAADFARAAALRPTSHYVVLWLGVAGFRAGSLDVSTFDDATSSLSAGRWPWAVVNFYRGHAKLQDVDEAADDSDALVATSQHCEANFYIGEWLLSHQDMA